MSENIKDRIRRLPCWKVSPELEEISGGITNQNFLAKAGSSKYFVRAGDDIPIHGVMRFNELAASQAAHAAGVSPGVVYSEKGILVLEFIDGKTLTAEDFKDKANITKAVELILKTHKGMPEYFEGPALTFWVFQVIRGYALSLKKLKYSNTTLIAELVRQGEYLESNMGPIRLVFGHNDLLPANFIDDGERMWLIDWDYAGFNTPLFDLGGFCSNNELTGDQETYVLNQYFRTDVAESILKEFAIMKCASLLRETMWSMVSEKTSDLDFDYARYTEGNLTAFQSSFESFKSQFETAG